MNFKTRFKELTACVKECRYTTQQEDIDDQKALQFAADLIKNTNSHEGIIYVIGNGGSAGIASHFSNDLMKALKIPSQTLYDSNLMTCLSNDLGYDQVFSYPLKRLLKPKDLLVAISSSGKSPNILNAVEVAHHRNAPVITLSGFSPLNPLRTMGQLNFWIDRSDYGLVEIAHFFLLHTLIDTWNKTTPPMAQHVQIARELCSK
jgi:D-sedoheptulose 7-phosphate isomerase